MTNDSSRKSPPRQVIVAITLLLIGLIIDWLNEVISLAEGSFLAMLVFGIVGLWFLYGLYRGSNAIRWFVIVWAALTLVPMPFIWPVISKSLSPWQQINAFIYAAIQGIALLLLLLPASNRWFKPSLYIKPTVPQPLQVELTDIPESAMIDYDQIHPSMKIILTALVVGIISLVAGSIYYSSSNLGFIAAIFIAGPVGVFLGTLIGIVRSALHALGRSRTIELSWLFFVWILSLIYTFNGLSGTRILPIILQSLIVATGIFLLNSSKVNKHLSELTRKGGNAVLLVATLILSLSVSTLVTPPQQETQVITSNEQPAVVPAATIPEPQIETLEPGILKITLAGIQPSVVGATVQQNGNLVMAATDFIGPHYAGYLLWLTPQGKLLKAAPVSLIGGSPSLKLQGMALTPDDKIIVTGTGYWTVKESMPGGRFVVARYLNDGQLDPTFNITGWTSTQFGDDNDEASAVAVQPDGKILVAGQSLQHPNFFKGMSGGYSFAIARYIPNGNLDYNFGDQGKMIARVGNSGEDQVHGITVLPNGMIMVIGYGVREGWLRLAIARYFSNGELDRIVLDGGTLESREKPPQLIAREGHVIGLQSDGKLIIGGSGRGRGIKSKPELKPGVVDSVNVPPYLARYDIDGELDRFFGHEGRVIWNSDEWGSIWGIAVQSDGKIVVCGSYEHGSFKGDERFEENENFFVARFTSGGLLDPSFAKNGIFVGAFDFPQEKSCYKLCRSSAWTVSLQKDGKIVAVGNSGRWAEASHVIYGYASSIIAVRLNPDGTPDITFGAN